MKLTNYLRLAAVGLVALASCGKKGPPTATKPGKYSSTTGIEYNTEKGMAVANFKKIPEGPGLVFIEGGRTVLGSQEEDVTMTHDNIERTVTIASFYMDEAEVANIHWLEYLHFIRTDSAEEFYKSALPDTTVWARDLSFNDPYVTYYLRYPGFRYFPVVGVSWLQADDYCTWRTAKVNERLAAGGDSKSRQEVACSARRKKGAADGVPKARPVRPAPWATAKHDLHRERQHPAQLPPAHRGRVGIRRAGPHRHPGSGQRKPGGEAHLPLGWPLDPQRLRQEDGPVPG